MNERKVSEALFKGALFECLITFPLFKIDYPILMGQDVLTPITPERCEWTKSKTSLAEYFRWIGVNVKGVTGGFWDPISRAFGYNKNHLRKLAGGNGNPCKPEGSKDFIQIKEMVLKYRKSHSPVLWEAMAFSAIRNVVRKTNVHDEESIRSAINTIENIIKNNVDKNSSKAYS
jgi:hypothetical protein